MQQNSENKSHAHWASLIAEQEKSGLSQKEFCIQRGLVLSKFVYYRCSFKNKAIQAVEQPFKPVKVTSKEPATDSGDIKLSLPNGFQCSFPCYLESFQIKQLLEVLLSC